jgi:hypothetical protein
MSKARQTREPSLTDGVINKSVSQSSVEDIYSIN